MPVLRPLMHDDLDVLVEVQREGAVAGLGHIFPQEERPFPTPQVRARWAAEIDDPGTDCFAVVVDGALAGFAATRDHHTPAPPGGELRTAAGRRCLDVPGFSTTVGTEVALWDCNGSGNQSWNWTADKLLTVYGNMCLAIGGDGSSAGNPAIITDCTDAADQTWELNDDRSITNGAHPELCLGATGDGTGSGTQVAVQDCSGQPGQQWTRP